MAGGKCQEIVSTPTPESTSEAAPSTTELAPATTEESSLTAAPATTVESSPTTISAAVSSTVSKTPKATITFRYYPNKPVKSITGKKILLDNKAILMNMCDGIKAFLGEVKQEIQLTKDTANRDAHRAIMCPDGWCMLLLSLLLEISYRRKLNCT